MQILNRLEDPLPSRHLPSHQKRYLWESLASNQSPESFNRCWMFMRPKVHHVKACSHQSPDSWVPSGFLGYIVMKKLEGVTLSARYFWALQSEEQGEIRDPVQFS